MPFLYDNHIPRWLIFFIDLCTVAFSIVFAYFLRFNFSIPDDEISRFQTVIPFVLVIRALSFYAGKTYAGIIRYTGTQDAQRIVIVITAGSLLFFLNNMVTYYFISSKFFVPNSIIIIDWLLSIFIMTSFRATVKTLYLEYKNPAKLKRDVIIFGAGELGIITKRTLDRDAGTKYKVASFVDDDPKKTGRYIEGVPIYASGKLDELINKNDVAHLIIAIDELDPPRKNAIADICLARNTKVLHVPPVNSWINGELSFKQIKKIKIEDILERDTITIDVNKIRHEILNKRVLVTGAAGSIGRELAIQLLTFNPAKLVLIDQAETDLYDLQCFLGEKKMNKAVEFFVADIANAKRMEYFFSSFRPELVYHAAAYKHVPVMECNPGEAVTVNVGGSKIICDLAVRYGASRVVMISTDKAVNPSNVMGASKRIAEIYAQSLSRTNIKTRFITTRFGNVIDSKGSVIPLFRKQIENGGPVTVTHPEIMRYFMTISEACRLVLEAALIGKGGEIFVFDMGRPIRIIDLAKKMILLSGLTLGKDIQILFSGLRPGEKLYEELLASKEKTLPTHHPHILIAKAEEYSFETACEKINRLLSVSGSDDNEKIVSAMKDIVPEFISQNSPFEALDNKTSEVFPISIGTSDV
ncbi:MAG: polysaccharide biosynthesis protein [Bacteroidetes bacterium]|nr:polysaccharide biosynthesis protein [Bacteroidota bacterium]